jgi:hypothetical protein
MSEVKIPILRPHDEPVLAGRLNGRRAFVRILEELPPVNVPTVLILDFCDVELATSSFLSEAVLPLRDHLRLRRPPVYVVVANPSEKVREEFEELLNRSGEALLTCASSATGEIAHSELMGKLDPKLLETFDLVQRKGETSAVELHADSDESGGIGPTAWNNRLAALASKSLLIETSHGRTKKYRPVLEIE